MNHDPSPPADAAPAPVGTPPLDFVRTAQGESRDGFLFQEATRFFPPRETLPTLFEAQVARTPDAIALTFENSQLTYAELNERANQLAHHLRTLGAGPEMLVAISVERSLDLVVGVLGILKSGAAYVPCDPDVPAERLAFILEDSCAAVLLTQSSLLPRLPALAAQIICLDRDQPIFATHSTANPVASLTPENLAYVIYTSGSTGQPKGVCVTHDNAARLFAATEDWFHFGPRDVWTLFHSYAFDFSVWEIWGALLYGGRLVIVPHLISRAPDSFLELLAAENVTVLNQTPSAFRQLMAAEAAWHQPSRLALHYVIFGGEALDLAALRPWFARHGDRQPQLVNMYGITETTVHVTYRPLTAADADEPASLIGRAIPDLDLYVLDAALQPCAIGETGELHVGGAGLARGYLHRPELTDDRFFANPHKPGGRLYKTGDLARYRPDGELEYLGRSDQQVKIRGHRVELGEIAARLRDFPEVRDAIVLLREVSPGEEPQLCGYVVTAELDSAGLRSFLQTRLPAYMVPAVLLRIDRLPLTANGKLDHSALPLPPVVRDDFRQGYVAPQTASEQQLADIWQRVLGLSRAGIDDNFFDLGGTSLLLLRAHSQLRAAIGRDVRIVELFQFPTIRALACHLEGATPPASASATSRAQERAALARSRLLAR